MGETQQIEEILHKKDSNSRDDDWLEAAENKHSTLLKRNGKATRFLSYKQHFYKQR